MATLSQNAAPEIAAATPAIELRSVVKKYFSMTALDNVSLTVERGEFVSLLGPSGCGKTTLLRLIGGFLDPDAGSVLVHGARVDGLPPNKRPVNTVFQSYALFPHKTVAGNVAFPLEIAKVARKERDDRVREMLSMVRLDEHADKSITALSGGQAQRVALARALVGRPEVLLLDEPLAALDLKLRKAMQLELRGIHDRLGTTFVYVTHDQEEALTMSDRIILMNKGSIEQQGHPRVVYDEPATPFASDFLGEANLLTASVVTTTDMHTELSVEGVTVHARLDHTRIAGERVVVSIRPERIRPLGLTEMVPTNTAVVEGELRQSVFLGNVSRYIVEIAPGVTVTAEAQGVVDRPLDVGERVCLAWDPRDAILLTEDVKR